MGVVDGYAASNGRGDRRGRPLRFRREPGCAASVRGFSAPSFSRRNLICLVSRDSARPASVRCETLDGKILGTWMQDSKMGQGNHEQILGMRCVSPLEGVASFKSLGTWIRVKMRQWEVNSVFLENVAIEMLQCVLFMFSWS